MAVILSAKSLGREHDQAHPWWEYPKYQRPLVAIECNAAPIKFDFSGAPLRDSFLKCISCESAGKRRCRTPITFVRLITFAFREHEGGRLEPSYGIRYVVEKIASLSGHNNLLR